MHQKKQERLENAARKSPFIHKMGKTPDGVVCPPYSVLSHSNGCPYTCDYCCLQLPLKDVDKPRIFGERDRLLDEVRRFLKRGKAQLLSAGETSDGLALDHVTHLVEDLAPLFAGQDDGLLFPREEKHKLLFVSKSANADHLLNLPAKENVVMSFSLNAPEIAAQYERGAAHPHKRLEAAAKCQEAGYEVRIRIDPIMPVEGWQALYEPLIARITSTLNTKDLRFTLGTIRHNPGLRECTKERGRDWRVYDLATSREGGDGRYRLPVALRCAVYGWFLQHLPKEASVALCKETEGVWRTLGLDFKNPKCNCAR
jgi:spore photoproduct lyase